MLGMIVGVCLQCAPVPDPRDSEFVVENRELASSVEDAVSYWSAVAEDTNLEVVDSCSGFKHCVVVHTGKLELNVLGRTSIKKGHGVRETTITIDTSKLDDEYDMREVVTHEVGHVFELPHTKDEHDVMRPFMMGGPLCVGEETANNWQSLYGTSITMICVGPD